ncbi:4Fe-4S dicluster domain-containing protein [Heliobacterium chlorum]|uniref:4Fe-4S dicluster domain-containing protein n=1 Tax=Heliobacterium chlorum TaxID=2698 RepID=A0ABR7SXN1_HELCL|nr:4Fe-4S dicluster domain-containing protein [Heliobacterium chlorum]MBC9783211.1 4Fe-4S dicluster domain-containing protein [Heliobacterium chlorum]
MNQITKEMRDLARELLASGEVKGLIGWTKGSRWYLTPPLFITRPEEAEQLYFDQFAVNNLTGLLLDYRYGDDKIALFVKGCDSRGIVRLLQDHQIKREKVLVIGVPCMGMSDKKAVTDPRQPVELPLLDKCLECRYPNPVIADRLIGGALVSGEPSEPKGLTASEAAKRGVGSKQADRFAQVKAIEAMSADEKYAFWQAQHEKCLRCYACRNICPACNCRECIFESDKKGWVNKSATPTDNAFFAVTRAMHVAGRCVECGECERVCPMDIPIMALNRKVIQDINELFGESDAGTDLDGKMPLGLFKNDDPEEFM